MKRIREEETEALPRLPYCEAVPLAQPGFTLLETNGFTIIDESKLPGGTKQRALLSLLATVQESEVIYAGSGYGYAQIALAYIGKMLGKRITIFAQVKEPRMANDTNFRFIDTARQWGATVHVRVGPLASVNQEAQRYHKSVTDSYLLGFGFHSPEMMQHMVRALEPLKTLFGSPPKRMWLACGSCTLLHSLHRMWPDTEYLIVQTGVEMFPDLLKDIAHYQVFPNGTPFLDKAVHLPPYDSVLHYDAKIWEWVMRMGEPRDVIFNVAGEGSLVRSPLYIQKMEELLRASQFDEIRFSESMEFPWFCKEMQSFTKMLQTLRDEIPQITFDNDTNVLSRPFDKYLECDGLSNHFTEEWRMTRCVQNQSPLQFWAELIQDRQRFDAVAREAHFRNDWHEALALTPGYKECNTFNPFIVSAIAQKYFAEPRDVVFLDMDMRAGDRFISALAIEMKQYIGFALDHTLQEAYKRIQVSIHSPSEVLLFPHPVPLDAVADLCVAHPPEQQSLHYSTNPLPFQQWITRIYTPFLLSILQALKPNGIMALYVGHLATITTRLLKGQRVRLLDTLYFRQDGRDVTGHVKLGQPRTILVYKKL